MGLYVGRAVLLCCRCLQKSGRNSGRDNSDYIDIQLSDNN